MIDLLLAPNPQLLDFVATRDTFEVAVVLTFLSQSKLSASWSHTRLFFVRLPPAGAFQRFIASPNNSPRLRLASRHARHFTLTHETERPER